MKLPRNLYIEGTEYAVRGMPRTAKYEGLSGIIYLEEEGLEILINRNLSDRQQTLTVLHEVLHAVLAPLKLNSHHEERVVRRLEEGLASTFEENPTFFHRLINLLRGTRRRTRSR